MKPRLSRVSSVSRERKTRRGRDEGTRLDRVVDARSRTTARRRCGDEWDVGDGTEGCATLFFATAIEQPAALVSPFASTGFADANFDTGRPTVPESTLGGETTCIVCFARVKSHAAVPCGHLCACGPCSELMQECPYCREPVMMWMVPRPV